jgi:hypothetical protein
MANRQPGHHTFGQRTSVETKQISLMFAPDSVGSLEKWQTVYNTDYKRRQYSAVDTMLGGSIAAKFIPFMTGNETMLFVDNFIQQPFYTGAVVTALAIDTQPGVRLAKAPSDIERMIGVVIGGTGPTIANENRLPDGEGTSVIVIQYSGSAPVLLQIGESVNARGKFLELSTGVSGTSIQDGSVGVGQFGVCETGAYASGMTGIIGMTGNYVTAFLRPVENE